MEKLVFNKLVRDKVPENIEKNGEYVSCEILNDELFKEALNKKLQEEADEVINAKTKEELTEELSDLQEVIYAIASANGIEYRDVEEQRIRKLKLKGGFSEKVFLNHTVDQEYVDANKGCLTCKNGSCRVSYAEKQGYEDDGKPKGHNCVGYISCYKKERKK